MQWLHTPMACQQTIQTMLAVSCQSILSFVRHHYVLHALQRTKHHAAAAVPAVSSSSQNSSFTTLQHRHSNVAAEQEMEEVSSKPSQRSSAASVNAALHHSHSNAALEDDLAVLHAHAQSMQARMHLHALLGACMILSTTEVVATGPVSLQAFHHTQHCAWLLLSCMTYAFPHSARGAELC